MKYFFGFPHWPEKTREYITEEEFKSSIENYLFLLNVCNIENHYDILINNYSEFEKCISGILINNFLAFGFDILEFSKNEREVIRLINNLLSSCRLFLDNNLKILSDINEEAYIKYVQKTNDLYDNNVEYRLLEYLRNELQHSIAPISIEFSKKFAKTKNDKAKESINIILDVDYLLTTNSHYIKKVKKDLKDFKKDKIVINDFIRKYIYLIGILLNEIRSIIRDKYKNSYSKYSELLVNKVQLKIPPEKELQKIVYLNKEDEDILIKYTLSDSLLKNIDLLQKRNSVKKDYSLSSMVY